MGSSDCSCFVWKGSRAKTQKGTSFWFSQACALGRIWNNSREKYLKEYLLCSLFQGIVQCTIDGVVVRLQQKKNAPNIPNNLLQEKTHPPSSKCLSVCTHHHVVIWDIDFLCAIFSKVDNGSILHIFFAFTANFLIILNRKFLIAAKWACLDEIVGHLKEEKEEEPEGEVLGESNTGSLVLPPLGFHFNLTSSFLYLFTLPPFFLITFPFQMTPKEENGEDRRLMTKEEEDVDILCSWMEVGGQPALPEGEAQGLLAEVSKFPCPLSLLFIFLFLSF